MQKKCALFQELLVPQILNSTAVQQVWKDNTPIDLPENTALTDLKEVYTIPTDITGMYTALSDIEVHPGSEDLIMEKMSDCSTDREDIFIFTYLQNIGVNVGQRDFKKVFSIPTDTGEFYGCPTDVEEVVDCPVTQRVKSVAYGKVEQSVRLIQVQEAAKPEQENEKRKRRKRKLKDKKRYWTHVCDMGAVPK